MENRSKVTKALDDLKHAPQIAGKEPSSITDHEFYLACRAQWLRHEITDESEIIAFVEDACAALGLDPWAARETLERCGLFLHTDCRYRRSALFHGQPAYVSPECSKLYGRAEETAA